MSAKVNCSYLSLNTQIHSLKDKPRQNWGNSEVVKITKSIMCLFDPSWKITDCYVSWKRYFGCEGSCGCQRAREVTVKIWFGNFVTRKLLDVLLTILQGLEYYGRRNSAGGRPIWCNIEFQMSFRFAVFSSIEKAEIWIGIPLKEFAVFHSDGNRIWCSLMFKKLTFKNNVLLFVRYYWLSVRCFFNMIYRYRTIQKLVMLLSSTIKIYGIRLEAS